MGKKGVMGKKGSAAMANIAAQIKFTLLKFSIINFDFINLLYIFQNIYSQNIMFQYEKLQN